MPIFRLGDMVRIKAGPFAGFTGRIEGINQAKALLKLSVEIFGRTAPVRVKYAEVCERLRLWWSVAPPRVGRAEG